MPCLPRDGMNEPPGWEALFSLLVQVAQVDVTS